MYDEVTLAQAQLELLKETNLVDYSEEISKKLTQTPFSTYDKIFNIP